MNLTKTVPELLSVPVIKATATFAHFTSHKNTVQHRAGGSLNSCICFKNSRSLTHTSISQVYLRKKGTATGFCLVVAFYFLFYFSSQSIVMIKIGCLNSDGGKKKTSQSRAGGHNMGEGSFPQGNREQSDTHRAIRTSICRLGQTGLRLHNFRIRQTLYAFLKCPQINCKLPLRK